MDMISKDNVSFYINGAVQYSITDAYKYVFNVRNLSETLGERSKIVLRNILSKMEINEVLEKRGDIAKTVQELLSVEEHNWGIKVIDVNIVDISIDSSMKQAMSVKAEADRNAQAKLINAKADIETAKCIQKLVKYIKKIQLV